MSEAPLSDARIVQESLSAAETARLSLRLLVKGLLLIATMAAIGLVLRQIELDRDSGQAMVDRFIADGTSAGEVLFLLAGTVITAVGLPRHLVSFLGGYAFGWLAGTALAVLATTLGCALAYGYAHFIGRELVLARFRRHVDRLQGFLARQPFSMTLVVRFLPVGSNLVTNLVAGVSGIPLRWFVLGSAVGYVPQTLVLALLGAGIDVANWVLIGLSVLLFVASALLGVLIYRRSRAARGLGAALIDADPAM